MLPFQSYAFTELDMQCTGESKFGEVTSSFERRFTIIKNSTETILLNGYEIPISGIEKKGGSSGLQIAFNSGGTYYMLDIYTPSRRSSGGILKEATIARYKYKFNNNIVIEDASTFFLNCKNLVI